MEEFLPLFCINVIVPVIPISVNISQSKTETKKKVEIRKLE